MSLASDYFTAEELAEELRTKTGMGTTRVLRLWRARGSGPPWAKIGKAIIYPKAAFDEWLKAKVQPSVLHENAALIRGGVRIWARSRRGKTPRSLISIRSGKSGITTRRVHHQTTALGARRQ